MNEELNKKLAEWRGFRHVTLKGWEDYYKAPEGMCVAWTCWKPNFTESLDACFKWLIPAWNTRERYISGWIENVIFCFMSGTLVRCTIQGFDVDEDIWADAETLALALCKAIEQLIDKGE